MDNACDDVADVLAPWLLRLVDPYDWGYRRPDGHVVRELTNDELGAWRRGEHRRWPQKLSRKLVLAHLQGRDEIHYVSSRSSGLALLALDVDAHKGQSDAFEAVELLRAYFPGCYVEPSRRGYHLFLLVRVDFLARWRFNALLIPFRRAVQNLLVANNLASTAEVIADFTTFRDVDDRSVVDRRGWMCRLPRPANVGQARALVESPVFAPQDLEAFVAEAGDLDERPPFLLDAIEIAPPRRRVEAHGLDEGNALARMYITFFRFTVEHAREPDLDELLEAYAGTWNGGPSHPSREQRARWVIDHSRFDPSKSGTFGYTKNRDALLALVSERVAPEHKLELSYGYDLSAEDLAIVLWVVVIASFECVEDKRKQFGCPGKRFVGAFRALRALKLTTRGCTMSTKLCSIKVVLQRAGLIQCLDEGYFFVPGNPNAGRGKKYAIGPTHPLYDEWYKRRPFLESRRRAA